jgi:hypothetical protein
MAMAGFSVCKERTSSRQEKGYLLMAKCQWLFLTKIQSSLE